MADINQLFPSKYLNAAALEGESRTVTIAKVDFEPVGQDRQMKPVCYFRGEARGLILNKTNATAIASEAGSSDTDDWVGLSVMLTTAVVTYQGRPLEALRVLPATRSKVKKAPAPEPIPPAADDEGAVF